MAKSYGPWAVLMGSGLLWALSLGAQAETNLTIRAVIIAPPPCQGGIDSRISERAHSAPIPVGP